MINKWFKQNGIRGDYASNIDMLSKLIVVPRDYKHLKFATMKVKILIVIDYLKNNPNITLDEITEKHLENLKNAKLCELYSM